MGWAIRRGYGLSCGHGPASLLAAGCIVGFVDEAAAEMGDDDFQLGRVNLELINGRHWTGAAGQMPEAELLSEACGVVGLSAWRGFAWRRF